MGYYQDGSWIIADLALLKGMLEEQKDDPNKNWENGLLTSVNQVEKFPKALWFDGKTDLIPKDELNSDGAKVITQAKEAVEEPPKKKKKEAKKALQKPTPAGGVKADQAHEKIA